MLTDQEIIDNVTEGIHKSAGSFYSYLWWRDEREVTLFFNRVLVRYTRWLERAEHKAEIDALGQRYSDSEEILDREAAWEVKCLQDEITHWKSKYYEQGEL